MSLFSNPVTLPVSLNVKPASQLAISPESVDFPRQSGFTGLLIRKVIVTSTMDNQVGYTATVTSSSPWLTLSTASQPVPGSTSVRASTPEPLYLIADSALAGSASEAEIRIETTSGSSVRTLTVRLMTSSQAQLTLTQEGGVFSYTLGSGVPPPQTLTVGSTGAAQQFRVTTGDDWFTASPSSGTTPGVVTIALDPARLAQMGAGTYISTARIASATSAIDVPVRLTVKESIALITEPAALEPFEGAQGQRLPPRFLIVRSTGANDQTFTIGVEYGSGASNWLVLRNFGYTGIAGDSIRVGVDPTRVQSPGVYEATIVIALSGNALDTPPVRIPVRYTVAGLPTVTASVQRIDTTLTGPEPLTQTIQVTGVAPTLRFSASATQPFLRLMSTEGRVPGSFTVTLGGLLPGEYTDTITIRIFSDAGVVQTIAIPVTLRVLAAVQGAPANVVLAALPGTTAPVTRTISLAAWSGPLAYTAVATSSGNWLSMSPASGTIGDSSGAATPLLISANPSLLALGTYTGTVTLNTPGGATPTIIAVRLIISTQPPPASLTIANAATGSVSNVVSPGMIVTIKGRNMAPAQGLLAVVINGMVQSTLGEVRVLFDELPAPLLYVGPSGDGQGDQINAIVPYRVGSSFITRMVVEYRGMQSTPLDLRVEEADPGLFTVNQSGSGQVAALNQDGTLNSVTNPAEQGSIVQLFGTGEGRVLPAGVDGQVIADAGSIRRPVQALRVDIANQSAAVTYAGSAPTLVSGVFQVNVRVPNLAGSGTPSGQISIRLPFGRQFAATVAVR